MLEPASVTSFALDSTPFRAWSAVFFISDFASVAASPTVSTDSLAPAEIPCCKKKASKKKAKRKKKERKRIREEAQEREEINDAFEPWGRGSGGYVLYVNHEKDSERTGYVGVCASPLPVRVRF